MKKTTFYFIRHGETDFNRKRIVQGRKINSSLNEKGRAQAEALALRFAEIPIDVMYCSTLNRASETARAISSYHSHTPLIQLKDLEEISWGVYEGKPLTPAVMDALEEMNARWKRGEFDYAVEEGESILEVQCRALKALDHILKQHEGGTIVVVTHGRFLRVLLATLLTAYGLERMHEIQHTNSAVNQLEYDGRGYRAILLNCTSHLDEETETILIE